MKQEQNRRLTLRRWHKGRHPFSTQKQKRAQARTKAIPIVSKRELVGVAGVLDGLLRA